MPSPEQFPSPESGNEKPLKTQREVAKERSERIRAEAAGEAQEEEPAPIARSTAEALEEQSQEVDAALGVEHPAPEEHPRRGQEAGAERAPEELHPRVRSALESLGMKPEDTEKIEGFTALSEGRQALVLENLKQLAYGRIAEEAPDAFSQEVKEAGVLKGIWKTATKRFQMARIEKQQANKYLTGGFEAYQPLLEDTRLVEMAQNGPEAQFTENGLELNYLSAEDASTPEEQEAVEVFNKAASEFKSIPDDWRFNTATEKQRARHKEALDRYEEARRSVLSFKKEQLGARKAALEMNLIDANVYTEQGLNTNPELEDALCSIADESHWKRALRGILPEKEEGFTRAGFFALGYATRTAASNSLGLLGASGAAAVFSGIRGFKRGKEEMREQQVAARKGKKTMVGEERDMKDASTLREKLEHLSLRFDEAQTEEERSRLAESLKARVLYAREKLDEDLVNFGEATSRYPEQYNLLQTLAFAQARATEAMQPANRGIRARFEDMVRPKIEKREKTVGKKKRAYAINKGIRSAVYSAAFAGAGWMLAEYFSQTAGEKAETTATEALERMRSQDVTQQNVDMLWAENGIHGPAPDVEDIREAIGYQGGSSVWEESRNQLTERFGDEFGELSEGLKLYNIDHVKDHIVRTPEAYGLSGDVVWTEMSEEQIKNIDWNKAIQDAGFAKSWEETPMGAPPAPEAPPAKAVVGGAPESPGVSAAAAREKTPAGEWFPTHEMTIDEASQIAEDLERINASQAARLEANGVIETKNGVPNATEFIDSQTDSIETSRNWLGGSFEWSGRTWQEYSSARDGAEVLAGKIETNLDAAHALNEQNLSRMARLDMLERTGATDLEDSAEKAYWYGVESERIYFAAQRQLEGTLDSALEPEAKTVVVSEEVEAAVREYLDAELLKDNTRPEDYPRLAARSSIYAREANAHWDVARGHAAAVNEEMRVAHPALNEAVRDMEEAAESLRTAREEFSGNEYVERRHPSGGTAFEVRPELREALNVHDAAVRTYDEIFSSIMHPEGMPDEARARIERIVSKPEMIERITRSAYEDARNELEVVQTVAKEQKVYLQSLSPDMRPARAAITDTEAGAKLIRNFATLSRAEQEGFLDILETHADAFERSRGFWNRMLTGYDETMRQLIDTLRGEMQR